MPTLEACSFKNLQREGAARLRAAGIGSAALDARLFLCRAAGLRHASLIAQGAETAPEDTVRAFESFIARRAGGEPVARILNEKEFWGLTIALGPDTLVPRPDSECIVEAALAHMADRAGPLRVLDLGTGSGCLLLALLSEWPEAAGIGVDIAQGALDVARRNATTLGIMGRAQFVRGNWAKGLTGPFDVIVSNPPYIPAREIAELEQDVREHDPRRALDGGADGLACYKVLLPQLPNLLSKDGCAAIETSPDLYAEVSGLVAATPGLSAPAGIKDLAGRWRGLRFGKDDFSF